MSNTETNAGDAKITALFRDWLAASRESDRHEHDEDRTEYDAASDRPRSSGRNCTLYGDSESVFCPPA